MYAKKYEWAGSQENGDCSLWVRAATLDFDDGEWECQVTASDFTTQDALTSTPVRLVVRGKYLLIDNIIHLIIYNSIITIETKSKHSVLYFIFVMSGMKQISWSFIF